MRAYGNEIFVYCRGYLREDAAAEDTVQTTFIQAYRAMSDYRGESTFRAWLYGIARHRCLDALKSRDRLRNVVEFVDEPPEPVTEQFSDELNDAALQRVLRICLSELSDDMRDAVLLRFKHDCTYSEIAATLRDNAKSVQTRVLRALPRLRDCVTRHGVAL